MRITVLCLMFIIFLPVTLIAAPVDVPKTGQITSYAVGDDGDLQTGVAWPEPRFANNRDGTITDNMTGCSGHRTHRLQQPIRVQVVQ